MIFVCLLKAALLRSNCHIINFTYLNYTFRWVLIHLWNHHCSWDSEQILYHQNLMPLYNPLLPLLSIIPSQAITDLLLVIIVYFAFSRCYVSSITLYVLYFACIWCNVWTKVHIQISMIPHYLLTKLSLLSCLCPYIYLHANTTLFWLQYLCHKFWNWNVFTLILFTLSKVVWAYRDYFQWRTREEFSLLH